MLRSIRFSIVLLLICMASSVAFGKEFSFSVQRDIEVDQPVNLRLDYFSGTLTLNSNDDGKVTIDAVKRVDASSMEEAEEIAAHIELKIERNKDNVTIATNYLRMVNRGESFWEKMLGTAGESSFGSVDWVISVPAGSSVTAVNSGGDMNIDNLDGNLSLISSAANISLHAIEGNVEIKNGNGEVRAEVILGPITVQQPTGIIALKFIEGDIRVKSQSASITVQQDEGAMDITTVTGSVDVQTALEEARDCFISTESGNVSLLVPRWSSGKLAIESKAGTVKTSVPMTIEAMSKQKVVGQFGEGGVRLSISSTTGDVTVAQY